MHAPLLTFEARLPDISRRIQVTIDTAASGACIDRKLAERLPLLPRTRPLTLHQAQGSILVTHTISTELRVVQDDLYACWELDAEVVDLEGRDILLGQGWLQQQGAIIDCENRTISFPRHGWHIVCNTGSLIEEVPLEWMQKYQGEILMLRAIDFDNGTVLSINPLDPTGPYIDFKEIFDEETSKTLPLSTKFDHTITLEPQPSEADIKKLNGPLYRLSREEDEELRKYLDKMIKQGKIRRSESRIGAPVLFVPKPHGRGLRLCVDYRALNKITIKNRYPIPRTDELQEKTAGATIFSRLDLRWGYNNIRIKEGEEWKTAFKTTYGLFEYLVLPFGLTNAPANFQDMMNEILREEIMNTIPGHGIAVYLDDILIFSQNEDEHIQLMKRVLTKLANAKLPVNIEKSEFHVEETTFLGCILGKGGVVGMEAGKVNAVVSWPTPARKKDLQAFLGFANYYRRFIWDYARKAAPLTKLTGKADWRWEETQEHAFQNLKYAFTSAPVLHQFDPSLPTRLETDTSNVGFAAVLSQNHAKGKPLEDWRPVDFHGGLLSQQQRNWPIHDKELWAIVAAFKKWRHWLLGIPVKVYSDYQGLKYFLSKPHLNMHQAAWQEELA